VRIVSLNINGLRKGTERGFFEWLRRQDADVVCLQEVRALPEQLSLKAQSPRGYFATFHPAERKGYSGVAIYSRQKPDRIVTRLGREPWDQEGRYVQTDFGNLSIASIYVPSGSSSEARQAAKFETMAWLRPELQKMLTSGRDFCLAGDWNIAHKAIDLKNWRGNQKNSGFLPEERAWISALFDEDGWVDTFRCINPDPEQYTWWSNRGEAWAKNVGWRIDYQICTRDLARRAYATSIYKNKRFSDHAPLTIDYRDHSINDSAP
jgi:exodeoxyribonuclease III